MKKIIVFLSAVLVWNVSFAFVMIESDAVAESLSPRITEFNKLESENLKTRSGRIVIYDKQNNVAIIGKKSYGFSRDFKIFDGEPKKGSVVRFNRNENNELTDMWILKK